MHDGWRCVAIAKLWIKSTDLYDFFVNIPHIFLQVREALRLFPVHWPARNCVIIIGNLHQRDLLRVLVSWCKCTLMVKHWVRIFESELFFQDLRKFYIIAVAAMFVTAMVIQIPYLNVSSQLKIVIFVGWALFGVLPTMHWAIKMGGFKNNMVSVRVFCWSNVCSATRIT